MTFGQRFWPRAAAVYVVLYWFPTPFDLVLGEDTYEGLARVWRPALLLAANLFSLNLGPYQSTGAGDTLAEWLRVGVLVPLASVVAATWAAIDRTKTNDAAVRDATRDYLRLCVLVSMIGYGMAKVLCQQFPLLEGSRVFDTYGDSSPMGLLWRFMGYSPTYQRFSGLLELAGALLLLTRRTTTAGALVLVGVLTNVVALNFCFDVPVKIYSAHLLGFSFALAAPTAGRLVRVLWHNEATAPLDLAPKYWGGRRSRYVVPVAMTLWGVVSLALTTLGALGPTRTPTAVNGAWEVSSQQGLPHPWRRLTLDPSGVAVAELRGDDLERYRFDVDAQMRTLTLHAFGGVDEPQALHFEHSGDGLVLSAAGRSIELQRLHSENTTLVRRGFHLVQEASFNR